jgi:HEAT repeat protein
VDCWSDRTSPGLEAARALGAIRSESAIEPLLEALRSPNPTLRGTAARALGLMMRHRR